MIQIDRHSPVMIGHHRDQEVGGLALFPLQTKRRSNRGAAGWNIKVAFAPMRSALNYFNEGYYTRRLSVKRCARLDLSSLRCFYSFFFLLFSPLLLSFSPLFLLFLLFFIVILLLWMIDGRQRYLRFGKIVWKTKLKIFRLDLPFNLLRANLVMFYFLFYSFFDWFTLLNSFLQFWFYFLMYYSIF